MGFKSTDAQALATKLYQLLDEVTHPEVLELDRAFYAAEDKHKFLAQFESESSGTAPKTTPVLLERWTHYRWIRLELLYLANQRAALNKAPSESRMESVNHAILNAKETGVSLPKSIEILKKIKTSSCEHRTSNRSIVTIC